MLTFLKQARAEKKKLAARVEETVRRMLAEIDEAGDEAVRRHALDLDNWDRDFRVSKDEIRNVGRSLPDAAREIQARPEALGEFTNRDNTIAIITDGTAVLGYGNAGPRAAMPVMEGKSAMFKMLAGIDCGPLCLQGRDDEFLVELMEALEPSFGGYNLEDVASPVCFEVMR